MIILVAGLILAPEYAVLGLAGIGIGIPLLVLVWLRPEYGLLALIFITSSIVPVDIIDIRLPIGGGFDIRDLTLLGLLGLLFVREISKRTFNLPWWPVSAPILLFLLTAVISLFYALIFQKVETNWAFGDLRILLFYAVFFMTVWSIKTGDQLRNLLIGLFIIADLITLIIYLQQFIGGDNPLLASMITSRDWRSYQTAGAVRVVPAGHVLMHFMWFLALSILTFTQLKPRIKNFFLFQILFIGGGHILTYMRAQWVAMFIGFFLISLIAVQKYKSELPKYLTLGLAVILIIALLWGTIGLSTFVHIPFVSGVVDRFVSVLTPEDTLETGSLQWRQFENGKALESLQRNPIMGVGLGGQYRELTTFHGEAQGRLTRGSIAAGAITRFTRYVHNSYLSIAVKMGLPGLIIFAWFCLSFLIYGWKVFRLIPDIYPKWVVLGVLAGFVGIVEWSLYHAHFFKAESVPVIAMMVGLVGVINSMSSSLRLGSPFKYSSGSE